MSIKLKTLIFKMNSNKLEVKKIQIAARVIKKGGLVAFPTETVYGLGADAFNPVAVSKIFKVKNRPLNDPLIVHIADKGDIFKLATEVPGIVKKLIGRFWPGPLTVILKKSKTVPDMVTANLDTVAIRMPQNKIALSLIRKAQTPIAAPSANIFGRVSATAVKDVIEDLNGKIDVIIDGGKTKIGVESTVVDFRSDGYIQLKILRPGAITYEMLKKFCKPLVKYSKLPLVTSTTTASSNKIRSPGMFARHYSPKAKLIVASTVSEIINKANKLKKSGMKVGILTFAENKNKFNGVSKLKILGSKTNLKTCAKNLFGKLREFDNAGVDVIIVEKIKKVHIGRAIMDRLEKAAGIE